ncbi:MAG TPA: hypothetical protein VGP22_05310 [Albitalea sp.]|jgi:hypothetical protein|nr:hypothetical protein [Albitalea sp.]
MPYVHRTALGEIESLHRQATSDAAEFLDHQDAEVQRFLGNESAPDDYNRLDAEFVRVIEDVIDTLIMKNVITITDLPAHAQAKLFARKNFRDRMSGKTLQLYPNSGFSDVIDDTGFGPL